MQNDGEKILSIIIEKSIIFLDRYLSILEAGIHILTVLPFLEESSAKIEMTITMMIQWWNGYRNSRDIMRIDSRIDSRIDEDRIDSNRCSSETEPNEIGEYMCLQPPTLPGKSKPRASWSELGIPNFRHHGLSRFPKTKGEKICFNLFQYRNGLKYVEMV